MGRGDCPAGSKWDNLVGICHKIHTVTIPEPKTEPEPKPPTEPPLRTMAPAAQASSLMLLSPALWVCVGLVFLGSVLALALWLTIYKRQTRHSHTSEDAEQCQRPLQKAEPAAKIHPPPPQTNGQANMLQGGAWAPSPCPHQHLGAQTGSKWEEGFTACSDLAKHVGTEWCGGQMREHRVPLPATELGGTALVTTKTV
ncbi:hypothetical protein EPR50_G00154590 [Perca flavescens]|uniref:Uncharacterized protein n=1 Tax=Perca flavescens TaxID=8167 RepID=A0A484CL09_PERFV|nr:hypothetical protein EPR50_G00154590 [Perca flavescens]